jgi:hypothetical protein
MLDATWGYPRRRHGIWGLDIRECARSAGLSVLLYMDLFAWRLTVLLLWHSRM